MQGEQQQQHEDAFQNEAFSLVLVNCSSGPYLRRNPIEWASSLSRLANIGPCCQGIGDLSEFSTDLEGTRDMGVSVMLKEKQFGAELSFTQFAWK